MQKSGRITASIALGIVLVGCGQVSTQPTHAVPAPTAIVRATPLETVGESPGCDPEAQIFADMFAGLTEAALANAGIDREAFMQALADDRDTLRGYLEALGIPADDEQLDALMGAGLPFASGLPFTFEGC